MDELTERLAAEQPIVMGGSEPTVKELRDRVGEMGYVLVKFTETRGGTELGVRLDRDATDLSAADFDNGTGTVHVEGFLILSDEPRFLRPDVIIEPLVDRFYAWLQTVAPVQAAMNLAFAQVPLLESYLQSPQVHINASRNPELRGGFFVNIEADRSGEVRDLLASIRHDRAELLGFAQAVSDAEEIVRQGATGYDMTPLYPKLPAALSGLVELAYDTNNQPSMRYIEPLVYESSIYTEDRQSVQLSLDKGVERPFILSTPRLPSPDVLELGIPFRHPGLEELFGAKLKPSTLARLREALELDDQEAAQLNGLLTDKPDLASDRHIDGGGRIRYFGHACLVLQTPEGSIITDPWLSSDASATDRF